jgi:hypothetical protein
MSRTSAGKKHLTTITGSAIIYAVSGLVSHMPHEFSC